LEPLLPNIFRFETDNPSRNEKLYSYLLVREGGNLIVPCGNGGGNIDDFLKIIEGLGGVDTQPITHNHDVYSAFQEAIYNRFGAKFTSYGVRLNQKAQNLYT
jgi:glyoxylase-like metal-dependent hydrolase (beta-lactamase superfamily II)